MKRRVIFILLFLTAGAVVNVAVAWGSALWAPIAGRTSSMSDAPDQQLQELQNIFAAGWRRSQFEGGWTSSITINIHEFPTVSYRSVVESASPGGPHRGFVPIRAVAIECIAGWPCRSLGGVIWNDVMPLDPANRTLRGTFICGEFVAIEKPRHHWAWTFEHAECGRFVPLNPLISGFAINTVFYAAVLWLLFAAPFALRKRRRIKRGLCPKCAYPAGTNEVCTECGRPVSPRRGAGV